MTTCKDCAKALHNLTHGAAASLLAQNLRQGHGNLCLSNRALSPCALQDGEFFPFSEVQERLVFSEAQDSTSKILPISLGENLV